MWVTLLIGGLLLLFSARLFLKLSTVLWSKHSAMESASTDCQPDMELMCFCTKQSHLGTRCILQERFELH